MKTIDFFQRSTIDDGSFATYTVDLWVEDRDRCRIDVCVQTPEMHSDLKRALRYRRNFLGRGLKEHLDAYSLRRGDRLEPTKGLPDVAQFESMVPPFWVVFWRCTDEDRLIHESPLFTIPGLSVQSQGPDVLHYWALGPVAAFVALVIWWLITTPLFAVKVEGLSTEDETRLALFKIRSKLWKYYKIKRSDEHFRRKGSEVWSLTEKCSEHESGPCYMRKPQKCEGSSIFVSSCCPRASRSSKGHAISNVASCLSLVVRLAETVIVCFEARVFQPCQRLTDRNCSQLMFVTYRYSIELEVCSSPSIT